MKFMMIDGYSLIYRAFFAMPELTNSRGEPVGAVAGFMNMLMKAMDEISPDAAAVAFDVHAPTFRHKMFDGYKATRKPTPPELRSQFGLARKLLETMGIPVISVEGWEGDDMLGTMSRLAEEEGMETVLITGDRDTLQLVSPLTHVLLTVKGLTVTEMMDEAAVKAKYGITPAQIPDLKGLMGDSSDNIPGIPGIGEKTALKLLEDFETVEGLLANTALLKGKQKEKVEMGAESARMSRELAVIDRNAPVTITPSECLLKPFPADAVRSALREIELYDVLRRMESRLSADSAAPAKEVPEFPVTILEDRDAVSNLAEELKNSELAAIDFGEDLTVCDGKTVYKIPLMVDLFSAGMDLADVLKDLEPLFEGEKPTLVLHDAKGWMGRLYGQDLKLKAPFEDLMVAGYLLNAATGHYEVPKLLQDILHIENEHPDAASLYLLWQETQRLLREQGLEKLYREIEIPLERVLFDMEKQGFAVDPSVLAKLGEEMSVRLTAAEREIFELAGGTFNINSPKQLGEVLFTKLGLPVIRKTKSGPSTDAKVLEQLEDAHPIIPLIVEYRQIAKLKGTYIDGMLPLVRTGRLHTQFNQTVTATGRLSSSEPNLQNIPVRLPEGRLIRKAFSASAGHVLVDADYSQIELRILAHMAKDTQLTEAFLSGKDIHAQTASQVFGVPLEEVTSQMRSAAKAVNFGIIYGISDFGLSRQLRIPRVQAAEYIKKYLATYSGVENYMKRVIEEGRERGCTLTVYGRRRPMPDLKSRDYNVRSSAERMAMNAPIQGTAADIIKLAMIRVDEKLREAGLHGKLVLQVHDELIVDAPEEEAEATCALLKSCMESVAEMDVPLVVDVHSAYSWFDAK